VSRRDPPRLPWFASRHGLSLGSADGLDPASLARGRSVGSSSSGSKPGFVSDIFLQRRGRETTCRFPAVPLTEEALGIVFRTCAGVQII